MPTQELSAARRERTYIKLSFAAVAGLVLFIALCWVGKRAYVRWQEKRMVVRAAVALQDGDYRSAALAAQTVVRLKPNSVPATRILAQVAERVGDRAGAIQGRRKVAELEPNSVEDALDWAMTAQSFSDIAETRRALEHLPPKGKETARYHVVLALLSHQAGHFDEEKREWTEALRIDPDEKRYRLQLALLQLQSPNESEHAAGVTALKSLRDYPGQRSSATRALVADGATHGESATNLLKMAQELREYPEATLSDRLLYLAFLHQLNDSQYLNQLSELQESIKTNPAQSADLIGWLARNNGRLQALDFIKTLPPEVLQQWPVPGALADLQLRLREWKKLEEMLKNANWREFDYFRHAYLARALRELDQPAASAHEWTTAAKSASEQAEKAYTLFKLADDWHWAPEAIDLLWDLTKYPERQRDALTGLYRFYASQGDTQGLYRVTLRLVELDPDNLDFKNNLAQIGLLLDAQIHDAQRLAAETYQKQPTNPAYASTYAYALLTEGKKEKAVEVLRKLTPEQLQDPAVSVYYGICLAAVDDAEGKTYLQAADKAALLPQEKALVEKAKSSLR